MTDKTPAAQLYDFSNMPLTVEQDILETLKRIEVLLTPKPAEKAIIVTNKARGK